MKKSKIKIAFTYLFFAAFLAQGQNINSGLIGKFLFDGNLNDSSAVANHGGDYWNSCTYSTDRFGSTSKSLNVNQATAVYCQPNNAYIISANQYSVSYWIYKSGHYGNFGYLMLHGDPENDVVYYGLNLDDFGSAYYKNLGAGILQIQNGWNHVVFTYNNGSGRYYLNGTFVKEITGYSMTTVPAFGMWLAWFEGSGEPFVDYRVDDIYIHNRVISDAEISILYDYDISVSVLDSLNNPANLIIKSNTKEVLFKNKYEKIEIVSLIGDSLFTAFNSDVLNVDSLAAGVYVIKLYNKDGISSSLKFVKQ